MVLPAPREPEVTERSGQARHWATYNALSGRERGPVVFAMHTLPARLGGRLEGTVRFSEWGKEPARPEFRVFLSRYHRFTLPEAEAGRSVEKELKWRTETPVQGQLRRAKGWMEVPVSRELPDDQPPATLEAEEERSMGALEVEAPVLEEPLFFEIPVLEPEEDELSEEPPDASPGEQTEQGRAPGGFAAEDDTTAEEASENPRFSAPSHLSGEPSDAGAEIEVQRLRGGGSRIQVNRSLNMDSIWIR